MSGALLLDVDADRDGVTVFDGDDRDLAVLASGSLSVGREIGGIGLSLDVGAASLYFDARSGHVELAGETRGLFAGTPLAALSPTRGRIAGSFRGPRDFKLDITGEAMVLGYRAQHIHLSLDPTGVRAELTLSLAAGLGNVELTGVANVSGFTLAGRANLTIAGLRLAGARVTLGTGGVRVDGVVDLPALGRIEVSGTLPANGALALKGTGTLRPFGLPMAGAHVAISPRGAAVAGVVTFLGSRIAVNGNVGGGRVSLAGSLHIDALVFKGDLRLAIANTGVRAMVRGRACVGPACVDLGGLELDTAGRACPIFPVIGKQCIRIAG